MMSRFFYTLLLLLSLPFFLLRALCSPRHRYRLSHLPFAERWGFYRDQVTLDDESLCDIWVHAVSVGESKVALALMQAVRQQRPELRFLLTTTTVTAARIVRAACCDHIIHRFAPFDLPGCIRRLLRYYRPRALWLIETELWPNTMHLCRRQGIPVILVNARLSARSARGYRCVPSYRKLFFQPLCQVLAQSPADAQRLQTCGVAAVNIQVTGNLKLDYVAAARVCTQGQQLRHSWHAAQRPLWIAASTQNGEEALIVEQLPQLFTACPQALLILAPRHPERGAAVCALCRQFRVARRSLNQVVDNDTQIVVADTLGELTMLYGASDLAFVGGSLVDYGGQNMIEPLACGIPVIVGKSQYNFAAVSAYLHQQGALIMVNDAHELIQTVMRLFETPQHRTNLSARAHHALRPFRGLNNCVAEILLRDLPVQGTEKLGKP